MKIKSSRIGGFTLIEIMIVVAIIGMLAAIAVPSFVNARLKAQTAVCISNLNQIDGTKHTWALENKASPMTIPVIADIQPYLGRGRAGKMPSCPADIASSFATSYSLNDLENAPTCLIVPANHHTD